MATDFSILTWEEPFREFLLHLEATRAKKTHRFYVSQLGGLVRWAEASDVHFDHFGKRDLDRYLVERSRAGIGQTTLHHDAVVTKAFFRWYAKNDFVSRSPLAEYEVRHAPKPARYMPGDEEMQQMLAAVQNYWNPASNPEARYVSPAKRLFHRDRNYALLLGLLDTAARIGEILSLKLDDVRLKERQILIRESKGREPRALPVSGEWVQALEPWLRTRAKVIRNVLPVEDEGWLFISETGGRMDESKFLKAIKRCLRWAQLSENITLHSLRRYSLNRLAKTNLLAAQSIAGHKETKTTLLYTKLDPDFVRGVHENVGVVRGILTDKRTAERRKRIV
jgi:site-specific recombinase XerD